MHKSLPSLDAILLNPKTTEVPETPAGLYAVSAGLARKATVNNFDRIQIYLERMPTEFNVMSVRDAVRISKGITNCPAFVTWATKHSEVLL
jgi:hypothetical protein